MIYCIALDLTYSLCPCNMLMLAIFVSVLVSNFTNISNIHLILLLILLSEEYVIAIHFRQSYHGYYSFTSMLCTDWLSCEADFCILSQAIQWAEVILTMLLKILNFIVLLLNVIVAYFRKPVGCNIDLSLNCLQRTFNAKPVRML